MVGSNAGFASEVFQGLWLNYVSVLVVSLHEESDSRSLIQVGYYEKEEEEANRVDVGRYLATGACPKAEVRPETLQH